MSQSVVQTRHSHVGPLGYFYLTIALVVTFVIVGLNQGWFPWLKERFPDPIVLIAAIVLGALIVLIASRQVFPIATAIAGEHRAMQRFRQVLAIEEDPLQAVRGLLNLRPDADEGSSAARTIADLRAYLYTCVKIGGRPTLGINELYDGFAGRLAVYAPRLTRSVQLLTAIGLLGTITGLVVTTTSQGLTPTTDDGMKNLLFTMVHGMGIVYVSAILSWGGAAWLYLYEMTVARSIDELCDEFWSMLVDIVLPVIQSKKFLQTLQEPTEGAT